MNFPLTNRTCAAPAVAAGWLLILFGQSLLPASLTATEPPVPLRAYSSGTDNQTPESRFRALLDELGTSPGVGQSTAPDDPETPESRYTQLLEELTTETPRVESTDEGDTPELRFRLLVDLIEDETFIPTYVRPTAAEVLEPFQIDAPDENIEFEESSSYEDAASTLDGYLSTDCSTCASRQCSGCCWTGCCRKSNSFVSGWISQGVTWNPRDPASGFNTPLTFNDRANEYQLNQLYATFERQMDPNAYRWDIGARVDLLYGTDYFFTTAAGLETHPDGTPRWNPGSGPRRAGRIVASPASMYGLAMPQAYVEMQAPLAGGIQVKGGHFYTNLGYESVMAPDNFFYSHSYTMQYGEPFTHTGILLTKQLGSRITARAGVVRGWNNWDGLNSNVGYLAGFDTYWRRSSLALNVYSGPEEVNGNDNRTVYSLVYTRRFGQNFTYVLQHDLGTEQNAALDANLNLTDAQWYGINQYLFYQVCPDLGLGVRCEWFRDDDNARVIGIPLPSTTGGNYFALTLGAKWQPHYTFSVSPEVRWDWSNVAAPGLGIAGMFDDFTSDNQFTAALNLQIMF